MPELDLDLIKKNLQHKSTQELVDILNFHLGDYDNRVIVIIEEILLSRNLSQEEIEKVKNYYIEENKKSALTPKKKSYWDKSIYWFVIGIPLLLLGRWVGARMAQINPVKHVVAPWSAEYTDSVYKGLYSAFMKDTPDSASDKLLAYCVTDKLKNKYLKGIDSIDIDSAKKVVRGYTKECMKTINIHFNWSNRADSSIKEGIRKYLLSSDKIPKKAIMPMCDCYVVQLRKLYPNGFTSQVSESIKDSLLFYCAKNISK